MTAILDDQAGEEPPVRRHRRRSQRQVDESLQNRIDIVRNALELFANYGYTKTTLHAIAQRVSLTRQGLLHHFQSKEGLFLEVINYERQWAAQQLTQLTPERGLAGLRSLTVFLGSEPNALHLKFVHTLQGEAVHSDAPDYVVTYVQNRLQSIRGNIADRLTEAQADGEIGQVDVPIVSTMLAGAVIGLQAQWLVDSTVKAIPAYERLLAVLTGAPGALARKG